MRYWDLSVSSTGDLDGGDTDTTTTCSKRVFSISLCFIMDRKDIRSSLLGLGLLETTAVHTYLVLLSRRSVKLALHFPPDHNSKEGTMSNQSICGRGAIVIVELSRTRERYINRWANISEQALRVQRRSLRLYLQVSCEVLYMPRVERESRLEH